MNQTITSGPNQSALDIIVLACGTLEGGMKFCAENDIPISTIPDVGTTYIIPDLDDTLSNKANLKYLREQNIKPGTAALPSAPVPNVSIILKPVMHVVNNISDTPSSVGYYAYNLAATTDFVNRYELIANYITANTVYYNLTSLFDPGIPSDHVDQYIPTAMPARSVPFRIPWMPGTGNTMVWSDLANPDTTVKFIDSTGNKVYVAPVILFDYTSQNVYKYLMGDITIEAIAITESSVRLRLTKSHTPLTTDVADFYHVDFIGIDLLPYGPTIDPDDPTNADKVILELPPGVYTFGVRTIYNKGGVFLPSSAFTQVIEITL